LQKNYILAQYPPTCEGCYMLDELKKILSPAQISTDKKDLEFWSHDWSKPTPKTTGIAVVWPKSTAEVAEVIKLCQRHKIAVVPSGGRTGLAGGANATKGEVIISLSKMQKIYEIDEVGMTICVEAGALTAEVQTAAKKHGLLFPVDLAAKGSSQIGGNIATNAGGLKFIRYAGMREQVLGLEVVLADGSILDLNTSLRKDNSGYDLKQLFIGSEGTLGIITKATLKIVQSPKTLSLACVGVKDFSNLLEIFKLINKNNYTLGAFEFFCEKSHAVLQESFPQIKSPFEKAYPYYGLIELEASEEQITELLEKSWDKSLVEDARIASSAQESDYLWSLRELITEALGASYQIKKNDVSLDIKHLSNFLLQTQKISLPQGLQIVFFGHLGDGNIHINYLSKNKDFLVHTKVIEEKIFKLLFSFKGSMSAEHGIGLLKKNLLEQQKPQQEIDLMKKIKNIFDPNNLLNPGKIF
jgi:glycolate oxidase subunit GlcD